jgi:hypothetical protein
MRIDDIEQEDADIDWFATDSNGHILHVASGGGILPESVAASQDVLLELHQYFLTLPEAESAEAVPLEAGAEQDAHFQGFARYAHRGLFSFAKAQLHDRADARYYVVARPVRPLTVAELPRHIATLLSRTKLPASVAQQTSLDISTIL